MNKEQKQQQVDLITEKFKKAKSIIFANYRGLNVADITELRRKLIDTRSMFKVIKNRLVKRAAREVSIEGLDKFLTGPTAIVASEVDPVLPAKVLVEFTKEHEALEIKAGYMAGKVLDLAAIKRLAYLPSREELFGKMLSSIKAPVTNFTLTLAAVPRQLVWVMNAIKDKKK